MDSPQPTRCESESPHSYVQGGMYSQKPSTTTLSMQSGELSTRRVKEVATRYVLPVGGPSREHPG